MNVPTTGAAPAAIGGRVPLAPFSKVAAATVTAVNADGSVSARVTGESTDRTNVTGPVAGLTVGASIRLGIFDNDPTTVRVPIDTPLRSGPAPSGGGLALPPPGWPGTGADA